MTRDFSELLDAALTRSPGLGLSAKDCRRYSVAKAIRSALNLEPLDGIEREAHDELQKTAPERGSLLTVPFDVIFRRDLSVGTFNQGGAFVQTTVDESPIEILRNRMVTKRLGVRILTGLQGNVALPRQTGTATAQSLPESATLTKSTQAIDQVMLAPHRLGASCEFTRQLMLQSAPDVENFIRDDILQTLAVKWDKLILEGAGAGSEPTGILNTIGIGSVHFATAGTPTWPEMIGFETALATANADAGRLAFATTPGVKANLKQTVKIPASTMPLFVWEDGNFNDGTSDGKINGYRAAATNQISGDKLVFGDWSQCIFAQWGRGFDVVTNPFSRDIDAVVRITVNTYGDVAVRHPQSFCWSDNAAA